MGWLRSFGAVAVCAWLVACGQTNSSPPPAPTPTTWADPSGRVTLTIPADWREYDVASAPSPAIGNELAIFAPTVAEPLAQCALSITPQAVEEPATPAATRALLNEATDALREAPFMMAYRSSGYASRVDLNEINGIRVLDIRGAPGALSTYERRFFFAANGTLELYTLACSAHAEDQAARLGANALANSLQLQDR